MTILKRYNPKDSYPIVYIGIAIILIECLTVMYAVISGNINAGKCSQVLVGTALILVFGMVFTIGIKYKETVYPKVNYVDFYENKYEFITAVRLEV